MWFSQPVFLLALKKRNEVVSESKDVEEEILGFDVV